MIQSFKKLPSDHLFVAVSGGVDSTSLLYWLLLGRKIPKERVSIAHMVHVDSPTHSEELEFVRTLATELQVPLVLGESSTATTNKSKEERWRDDRRSFFLSLPGSVLTGHTLDDAVEWYLFNALNGRISLMPHSSNNISKPFLTQRKSTLVDWMNEEGKVWLDDPSNADENFAKRNHIRLKVLPVALESNPGLFSLVKRMLIEKEFPANK